MMGGLASGVALAVQVPIASTFVVSAAAADISAAMVGEVPSSGMVKALLSWRLRRAAFRWTDLRLRSRDDTEPSHHRSRRHRRLAWPIGSAVWTNPVPACEASRRDGCGVGRLCHHL